MSRRTVKTIRRPVPHVPVADPDASGTCRVCHLPLSAKSSVHLAELPATDPEAVALEARRLGEHPDGEP